MEMIAIILTSATVLMLGSTLLCGLWLRAKGSTPEGVAFHAKLAVPSAILALVTVIILAFHI